MDNILNWSQIALYAGAAALAIVGAVSMLFKAMGTSYGGIIAALQMQNTSQQTQINDLKCEKDKEIAELRKDSAECLDHRKQCQEELAAVKAMCGTNTAEITKLKNGKRHL